MLGVTYKPKTTHTLRKREMHAPAVHYMSKTFPTFLSIENLYFCVLATYLSHMIIELIWGHFYCLGVSKHFFHNGLDFNDFINFDNDKILIILIMLRVKILIIQINFFFRWLMLFWCTLILLS